MEGGKVGGRWGYVVCGGQGGSERGCGVEEGGARVWERWEGGGVGEWTERKGRGSVPRIRVWIS